MINALIYRYGVRFVCAASALLLTGALQAATYHVDFESGADDRDGLTPDTAFKHAPGDPQAKAASAKVKLTPGDVVKFKGGVVYRGGISITASGEAGKPIIFDGNTAGDYGAGKAIIDGSDLVSGWVACKSLEDSKGNPNWQNIYYASVPGDTELFTVNAIQDGELLSMARTPDSKDPFYIDELSTMRPVVAPAVQTYWPVQITTSKLIPNKQVPIENMVDGNPRTMAVVDPMLNAEITFTLTEEKTVSKFAIRTAKRPAMPKEIDFIVDDKIVATGTADEKPGLTEFPLDKPVTFKSVTMKVRSVHAEDGKGYGAIMQVQAITDDGKDVLGVGDQAFSSYVDPTFFNQPSSDYYHGATMALWVKPNIVTYLDVKDFDPATHKLRLERLTAEQYPDDKGKIAILNAMGALDRQGEFYLSPDKDAQGNKRLYVWPLKKGENGPQGITISRREDAFAAKGQSHFTVQGFVIEKQSGDAAHGAYFSQVKHVTLRDNEIRQQQSTRRDSAIAVVFGENILIENNYIHHNKLARGMRLTITDSVVNNNRLVKNGSTGIGFFSSKRSAMTNNTVTEHTGVHANGLTVYSDSQDILVEGNRVFDGNIALTIQNSANVRVRNNILTTEDGGNAIGIWAGWHRNLKIEHNVILGANGTPDWAAGIFTNSSKIDGLLVCNNIIAGTSGNLPGDFSHNIYVFAGLNEKGVEKLPPESMLVTDLGKIFVDPAKRDFRLKPGSPAIDAGVKSEIDKDITGEKRPQGNAPDIGAYESKP